MKLVIHTQFKENALPRRDASECSQYWKFYGFYLCCRYFVESVMSGSFFTDKTASNIAMTA